MTFGIVSHKDSTLWKKILPQVQQQSRARAAELVGKRVLPNGKVVDNPNAEWSITETTRDRLKTILNDAIDQGWTANQTQSAIIDSEAFSPARALNISRTESAYARGRGSRIAASTTGMKTKEWLLGENPCDICQENADAGRIPIDAEFPSGDLCEPAHPSCRCTCAYFDDERSNDDGETEDDDEGDSSDEGA
jgi:hypothetical protein